VLWLWGRLRDFAERFALDEDRKSWLMNTYRQASTLAEIRRLARRLRGPIGGGAARGAELLARKRRILARKNKRLRRSHLISLSREDPDSVDMSPTRPLIAIVDDDPSVCKALSPPNLTPSHSRPGRYFCVTRPLIAPIASCSICICRD
jgi:hypothetical protein